MDRNDLVRRCGRAAVLFTIFLASCTPARFAIYSRPGGAEVSIDGGMIARTVNEATPVRVEMQAGEHLIRVFREGYHPWERTVKAELNREVAVMADLVPVPPPPVYIPEGSMEIRARQSGVKLYLNDKLIGTTKSDGTPVVISGMSPGKYILRFVKDGYEPIEERYEVFANQTTRAEISLSPLKPYYCFPNNDDLMRLAAIRTVRGMAHLPGMRSTKTIAVVNLAGDDPGNEALRALVEDAIIAELARHGRAVAEREDHLLVRIANEAARGESLTLDVLTAHGGRERPFLYDARLRSFADAAVLITENRDGSTRQMLVRDVATPPSAHVPTADQILGYKIVEKNLRADVAERPGDDEKMLRREAVLRLFVRLIDARTGVVEWAERFEASLVDRVPERVYRWLEHPPSRVYAYDMQANAASPAPTNDDDAGLQVIAPSDLERMNDRDALFWFYRNVGESYLRAGRFDESTRMLEEAVHLRPDDYEAKMFLAESRLKSGDIPGANRDYVDAFRTLTTPTQR